MIYFKETKTKKMQNREGDDLSFNDLSFLEDNGRVHVVCGIKSMDLLKTKLERLAIEAEESEKELQWEIILEGNEDVIVVNAGRRAHAIFTSNIRDYDRYELESYLEELSGDATISREREVAMRALVEAKLYPHHNLLGFPRSTEDFEVMVQRAIRFLTKNYPEKPIVWDVHESCVLGCDCFIIGVRKKKIFHIDTALMENYDRGNCEIVLGKNRTVSRIKRLYKDA